jgi:hypothetical protein
LIVGDKQVFGGRATRIKNASFEVTLVTAKDGLFSRESLVVLRQDPSGLCPVAKVRWPRGIRKEDRLAFHVLFAGRLDDRGSDGSPLRDAIVAALLSLDSDRVAKIEFDPSL